MLTWFFLGNPLLSWAWIWASGKNGMEISYCPYTFQQFFTIGPSHTSETVLSHGGKIFNSEDDFHNPPLISQLRGFNACLQQLCFQKHLLRFFKLTSKVTQRVFCYKNPHSSSAIPPISKRIKWQCTRTHTIKNCKFTGNGLYLFILFFYRFFPFFIIQWNTCYFT